MEKTVNYKADIKSRDILREFTYDKTVMLTLDISYPEISLKNSPIIQYRINRAYEHEAMDFQRYAERTLYKMAIQEYKDSIKNNFPFRPFDAVMKYTVTLNRNCHLSSYSDKYQYTGGAHGGTVRIAENFNLQSGRRIKMGDLFGRGVNYRALVIEQILKLADKQTQEEPIYFDNYRELIVKYFNPESFYLTPKGMTVYYGQYEVGPYAIGIVEFEIPYETLGIEKPTCAG